MSNSINFFKSVLSLIILFSFFSGCANLAPVRTFADQTKKLSAAFEPMLAGSTTTCIEKYTWKKLITSQSFDALSVEAAAKELCKPIDEDNKIISDLNSLLSQYADTLSALSNEKLPTYDDDLNKLSGSLGKLKKRGTSEALFNSDELSAVTSLTEFLSRIATQNLQKKEIRKLLGHEKAVAAITRSLKDYAEYNYRGWLNDQKRESLSWHLSLVDSRKSETLAANYVETLLVAEDKQVDAKLKAIDAFKKSLDEFNTSNSELREKFDKLEDKELLNRLLNYAKEVSKLHKQVNDAF